MSCIVIGVAAVGAGLSIYGSSESSSAQKKAAANNTYLTDEQADATYAASVFQNNLNKQVAYSRASVDDQNASVYHQAARSSENLGFIQESRQLMQQGELASKTRADYGASGIEGDTGSPLEVAGHEAAIGQMSRMDTAYRTNLTAMQEDWQGALSTYQATLERETAKQYDFANDMAKWTKAATRAGAVVQQNYAGQMADAQMTAAYGSATSSIGGAIANYGYAKNVDRTKTGTGSGATSGSSGGSGGSSGGSSS